MKGLNEISYRGGLHYAIAKICTVAILFVICNLSFVLYGAPALGEGHLAFRHYQQEQGLPANCVRDIAQDDRGFMWFATDGGLARFDGYEFRHYILECDPPVHDDNYTSALLAANGDLWVGTDAHLFRYDEKTDVFRYVPILDDKDQPVALGIRNIVCDRDGHIWINAQGQGVILVLDTADGIKGKFYRFPEHKNVMGWIYADSRNDVWATSGMGAGALYKFDKNQDRFKPFMLHRDGSQYNVYGSVLTEDEEHHMWLGDWDGRLVCFDPFSGDVLGSFENVNGQQLQHIHTLTPVGNSTLMVGSDAGLGVLERHSGRLRLYKQDELDASSLSDQFVYPIMQDREGGVWIGTFYGGVNYLVPNFKSFEKFQPSRYVNSVAGKVISAFAEDSRGNIYISSDDNGLSSYVPATGHFQHYRLNGNGPENLHALMVDGNDLWIGSYGQGIFVMDLVSGKVRSDFGKTPEPSSYAMLRGKRGDLWIASGNWFCRYDKQAQEYEPIKDLNALIVDIKEDAKGCLWISTQGYGLYRYNPANEDWRNFRYSPKEGALPHNHVSATAFDGAGRLWVGTAAGLACFDPDTETFALEHKLEPVGSIFGMVEDQNTLWLATNIGLVKFVPDGDFEVFTASDGLCEGQATLNAMLKASNGRIYTGTCKGFSAFFPYQIRPNENRPSVALTGLEINNKPIFGENAHLGGSISNLERLELDPEDHNFGLTFSSLSFVNPEKNQYEYKLEGFDKDWVKAGSQNRAYYTNLPPGSYKFRVRGSNSDNLWGADEATLTVKVLPPWYASWWMKLIYFLVILGVVVGLVFLLMRRSNQKHRTEMRRLKNEKEIEVYQAKLSFFTMVAHEIRTPVSLIIGPLEKLMKRQDEIPESVNKDLNIIERNSQRLLFLVNQLLDFKKVEEAGLNVHFRPSNITQLVHGVTDRFGPSMEQKGITLNVRCDVPADFTADVDYELVTKLVSNLMNNARKFTKDYVECAVVADEARNQFVISVKDNGIGVSKSNQEKIFRPFYQVNDENKDSKGGTGLGLSIVRNVVEAHGGTIAIDSELGKGTTFIATLPIHQAEVEDELPEDKDVKPEQADVVLAPTERKVKMLVVDDNDELCNFIANSFSEQYDVITAEDGEEAWKALHKHPDVNLIISDWMMPKKDGVELCREVRADKNISHIPFVLLTAKTDDMSKIEGLNCGADAYVEKPFSVQVLQARIENLMHMREMLRRKYSETPLEPIESIAPHSVDNEFLTELTRYIEENFSNTELDVDFLADKMDMSRSSLYSKIRGLVDVTPNDLIRITRLKHAARLLAEGKYRINEVCYSVGFNSPSYFAKCFQKQFGVSPSDFLAHH